MVDTTAQSKLSEVVSLRLVGIDDLADVRHVHAAAFRHLACLEHTDEEIIAFVEFIHSLGYVDLIIGTACYGAWIDGTLVATCGWAPADDESATARISDLFVDPLFSGIGLGHMLITHAEARATEAGFRQYSARVSVNAVPMFERVGYEITSHGVRNVGDAIAMPVTFMRRRPVPPSAPEDNSSDMTGD